MKYVPNFMLPVAGLMLLAFMLLTFLGSQARSDELNIYSYRKPHLIEPLIDRFQARTGIVVNSVFLKKGLLERLEAEGINSPADIVMTVDIARLKALTDAGLVQSVSSDVLEANIPAQYRDPNGMWFGLTTRARAIYYSVDRVNPSELSTYLDLANPKWKGRICIRSGHNIYNRSLISSMINHHGEAATEVWLKGLRANLARKPQGNDRAQVKAIAEGLCDLSVGNTYYMGKMKVNPDQQAWADAAAIFFPNQDTHGTHVNISGVSVTKSATNIGNAIAFLEFLSSDAAQEIYARDNLEYPVKDGIPWHPEVESWGGFKADSMNLIDIAAQSPAATMLVDKVGFDN